MSSKIKNNKGYITQDILIAIFIILVFTAIISSFFIKLASISYEIKETTRENKFNTKRRNSKRREKRKYRKQ